MFTSDRGWLASVPCCWRQWRCPQAQGFGKEDAGISISFSLFKESLYIISLYCSQHWDKIVGVLYILVQNPTWKTETVSLFYCFLKYFICLFWVLVAAYRVFSCCVWDVFIVSCGISFPDHRLNPNPLQWKHGALATGPPGKFRETVFRAIFV